MKEEEYLDLAAAILDGTPVSWASLPRAGTAPEDALLQQLRLLADVRRVHRAAHSPVGTTWGPLVIGEPLGAGTFGDVYKARDTVLERDVALKLLRSRAAGRHLSEGRALARVRHPNVVTVFGAAEHNGACGIWMEFIEGETLAGLVARGGPLDAAAAIAIGVDVCRALAAVHAAGILHGDIKAENVMRERSGQRVVLMDFGTGRVADDPMAQTLAGTPLYIAPEVLNGAPPDARADVYGVGVLLYYVLTGSFPVEGRTLAEVRAAHGAGARIPIRSRREDVPHRLAAAIDSATLASPAGRFERASDLADALERAAAAERSRIGARSRAAWSGAAAIALTAGLFGAGLTTDWSFARAESSRTAASGSAAGPVSLSFEVTPRAIVARDATGGAERWRYSFPAEEHVQAVNQSISGPGQELRNADGAIFAVNRLRRADSSLLASQLVWLTSGGLLKGTFEFSGSYVFGEASYGGPWVITNYQARQENDRPRIAVVGRHYNWWPAFLTILDGELRPTSTFVNAGWVTYVQWLSSTRLLISGFSNAMDGAMVALLDADALDGHSPDTNNPAYRCRGCGGAVPLRYVVMPRTEINSVTAAPFNEARLEVVGDRVNVRTMEVPGGDNAGAQEAFYEFTPSLELVRASLADRYWDKHRALEREGKIGHSAETCPDRSGPRTLHVWEPATGWRTVSTRR